MIVNMHDTIAAIATAPGQGGIGIVKISGPSALDIGRAVFAWGEKKKTREADEIVNRHLYFGYVFDKHNGGQVVDEALSVYMKGPNTYTGEDIVEINCHGSMLSLKKTLSLVLKEGARLAEPGEFTKRAFLNQRMDLSQAEAVIDLIKSRSHLAYDVAVDQMQGSLTQRVQALKDQAMEILSEIIVNVDYPDEDLEELTLEKLGKSIVALKEGVDSLSSTFDLGKIIREGYKVAIIGRPNVGKSSLLNALLRESRAIVTEIPGTTRDAIEEALAIGGASVTLVDTAGMRDTDDKVESIGIEKSKKAFNEADLVILVIDGSKISIENLDQDIELIENSGHRPVLVCINKIDSTSDDDGAVKEAIDEIKRQADFVKTFVFTSAKTGQGIEDLESGIEDLIFGGQVYKKEDAMVTSERQVNELYTASQDLGQALEIIGRGEALDFVEMEIRNVIERLGNITGAVASEDILDEVFSRFCIGK